MFEDNGNKCGKCQNHDFEVLKKGHARECPFKKCNCLKCKLLDARSDILQVISGKESKLKGTKKDPNCGFCQNHGVKILRKGHVRSCDYGQEHHFRLQDCFDCEVHYIRNEVNRLQIKMRRAMKEDRTLSEEQRKTAREAITREEVEKVCNMAKQARIKRESILTQQQQQQQHQQSTSTAPDSGPSSQSAKAPTTSIGPVRLKISKNMLHHNNNNNNNNHHHHHHLHHQRRLPFSNSSSPFSGCSSPPAPQPPPPGASGANMTTKGQLASAAYAAQAAAAAAAAGVTGGCLQATGVWRPWSHHHHHHNHQNAHKQQLDSSSPPDSPLPLTTTPGRPPSSINSNNSPAPTNQIINQLEAHTPITTAEATTAALNQNNHNNQFFGQLFRIIMAQFAQQQQQQQHNHHG